MPSVCPPRRVPIRVSPRQRASRAGSRATPSHHRSRVRHQRFAIYLQPIGSPEAARVRPLECPVRTQPRPVYVHRWQHPKYSEVALLSGCLSLSRGSRWPSMALLFSIWYLVSLLPLAAAADDERGLSSAGNSHVRTVFLCRRLKKRQRIEAFECTSTAAVTVQILLVVGDRDCRLC